jgi:hypothetical protein
VKFEVGYKEIESNGKWVALCMGDFQEYKTGTRTIKICCW